MNLLQINLDFGQEAAGILPGVTSSTAASPEGAFGTFLGGIFSAIMVVAILLVLVFLLWGALEWISSGGDKGKVEQARGKITTAVIGLIVLSSTVAIFIVLQRFLGVEFFSFGSGGGSSSSKNSPAFEKTNGDSGLTPQQRLDQRLQNL